MDDSDSPPKRLGDLCEKVFISRWDIVASGLILAVMGGIAAFSVIAAFWRVYRANWAVSSWILGGVFCAIAAGLLINGLIFAKNLQDSLTHRFDFCLNGFRYYHCGSIDRVLWAQVSHIRETTSGPSNRDEKHYKIVTESGKEFDIIGNSKAVQRFAAILRDRAAELSLPWQTELE